MTFIKPKKYNNSFLNLQIFVLVGIILIASIWLIVLYNRTVALRHGVSSMNKEIKTYEAEKAELTEEMIALFESQRAREFALERGLVVEINPIYLEVSDQWAFASHF